MYVDSNVVERAVAGIFPDSKRKWREANKANKLPLLAGVGFTSESAIRLT